MGYLLALSHSQEASTELLQTQTNHRCYVLFLPSLILFVSWSFLIVVNLKACVTQHPKEGVLYARMMTCFCLFWKFCVCWGYRCRLTGLHTNTDFLT